MFVALGGEFRDTAQVRPRNATPATFTTYRAPATYKAGLGDRWGPRTGLARQQVWNLVGDVHGSQGNLWSPNSNDRADADTLHCSRATAPHGCFSSQDPPNRKYNVHPIDGDLEAFGGWRAPREETSLGWVGRRESGLFGGGCDM